MKKLSLAVALALCTLAAATIARAQLGVTAPAVQGIFNPTIGAGADYNFTDGSGKNNNFELSIVGKEAVQGVDGYWMEMTMQDAKQGQVVAKMLLVYDGPNSRIDKMVVMIPGRGAMSMPMGMMGGRGAAQQPKDIRNSATNTGKESVTVPAGTFNCDHWHMNDGSGDAWVSTDVSPYGLVKMVNTKDNMTMVLTKTLTGVQDKITGPVTDMSQMMRGMGNMPPQQ
jgi:hypothetical protein